MKNKNFKKLWVIEKYNQYSKQRNLLAVLNSRLSYAKIIFAMKILIMGNSNTYNEILNVYSDMKNENEYPHQYLRYPIIIAGNSQYYKASYRAWIADFDTETGKYTDIDTALRTYQKNFNFNKSPYHN